MQLSDVTRLDAFAGVTQLVKRAFGIRLVGWHVAEDEPMLLRSIGPVPGLRRYRQVVHVRLRRRLNRDGCLLISPSSP